MSKDINSLHPDLKPLCEQFLADCSNAGLDVRLIFTYRSPEEQDVLYAQGRTTPGSIVTNLRGGQSKHSLTLPDGSPASKAFDFGIFRDDKYITDGQDPDYLIAGEFGERLGMLWGGRWHNPVDPSHLQIV